ncbi:MAG: hypothetical protein ABFQ95_08365 [Pseudomonadota bacterium]
MKRFYLLPAVLFMQLFCFAAENCSANIENISEQSGPGKNILNLTENAD